MAMSVVVVAAVVASFGEAEVSRIQTHLRVVEGELRAADVSGLTAAQRGRRAALIAELTRYRDRAAFPRNLDFEDPTPYFIDDRGVRCAMAHLIENAGGGDLVRRVAETANNAYVRELATDADLVAWLALNGLTLAEAARIQPSYPESVGAWCAENDRCQTGLCVPLDADPEFSYCSTSCDPEDPDSCPAVSPGGPAVAGGAPMECAETGESYICAFAGATIAFGDACDPDDAPGCIGGCVWHEAATRDAAICTHQCGATECPAGYACLGAANIEFSWCFPVADADDDSGGCATAAAGGQSGLTLVWLGLVIAAFARRRRAA